MKILLDTHAFIWFVENDPALTNNIKILSKMNQTLFYLVLLRYGR